MEQEASPTTPIDNEVKKKKLKKSILRIVIGTVLLGCIGLGYVEYKHQDIINIRRIEFPDILEEMPMLTPQQIAIQNENYEKFKKNEMSVPCEEVKLLMSCSKRSECITLEENGQRCFGHECSGKKLVSCTSMPKEQYDKEIVQLNNCKDTGGYWYSGGCKCPYMSDSRDHSKCLSKEIVDLVHTTCKNTGGERNYTYRCDCRNSKEFSGQSNGFFACMTKKDQLTIIQSCRASGGQRTIGSSKYCKCPTGTELYNEGWVPEENKTISKCIKKE